MGLVLILTNSCKKDNPTLPVITTSTVTDVEGNIYYTVTIGTQVWMKENLKTTKYRNGDLIGTTTPATLDITSESTPKYQWAYDGNESNVATYGRLYTGYAMTDTRNVCPTGWHVPAESDWTTLTSYLGGISVAGGKLKETGTTHWLYPNTGATNESGFGALPGGHRNIDGTYAEIGSYGTWWSPTEGVQAFLLVIGFDGIVFSGYYNKHNGYSVRCLKDQ